MLDKGYHLSSMEWSYVNILNIDNFLEDFKYVLHEGLVRSTIKLLKSYRDNSKKHPVVLNLGGCRLEVKGINDAVVTVRGLEYALENYFQSE